MGEAEATCKVRQTRATRNGYLSTGDRCGQPAVETFDDQLVGWVNEEWVSKGFIINGNSICQEHLDMSPEV